MRIPHAYAVSVEYIVRKALICESGGYAGLVSADMYESHPIEAALAIALKYYREEYRTLLDDFFCKWRSIFDGNGVAGEQTAKEYADELSDLLAKIQSIE